MDGLWDASLKDWVFSTAKTQIHIIYLMMKNECSLLVLVFFYNDNDQMWQYILKDFWLRWCSGCRRWRKNQAPQSFTSPCILPKNSNYFRCCLHIIPHYNSLAHRHIATRKHNLYHDYLLWETVIALMDVNKRYRNIIQQPKIPL